MTEVVTIEVAESEFERFVDAMDLDLDTDSMDAETLAEFSKTKRRLIKAVQKGALVFNDDGEAVYTPQNPKTKHGEPLTFHERTGASIMAMDSKKKGHDVARGYAVMADMCKVPPNTFASMVGIDIKICEALLVLLMD